LTSSKKNQSITSNTYFRYYLNVTDVASRFFVPNGIQDKSAKTVFRAIQEWAASYGPSATFNLSQLTRIHGDFDSTIRSQELTQLAQDANIRLSFAAPRHQEQNGISESNWKNVRNLAFACLNDAKMNMSYFHCALEQAWKIHSVLPHNALTKQTAPYNVPSVCTRVDQSLFPTSE
jgi:transposase InsO family protein